MHNTAKFARTPDEQIALLLRRRMHIADKELARHHLSHINYHRFSAYWRPLKDRSDNGQFRRGASFDEALAYYLFDGDLRILMIEAIKYIEVSVRAQWVRHLLPHGEYAHLRAELCNNKSILDQCAEKLRNQIGKNRRTRGAHNPPVWEAAEAMSFSLLSRWYKNQTAALRQKTADAYEMDEQFFASFLHSMTVVRNHCAHHERLWDRKLAIAPKRPRKKLKNLKAAFNPEPYARFQIHNMLVMTAYLTGVIRPAARWRERVIKLICAQKYDVAAAAGFPANWRDSGFWN